MKWLVVIMALMIPNVSYAADRFLERNPNVRWKIDVRIAPKVRLKSTERIPVKRIKQLRAAYKELSGHFESFMQLDVSGCNKDLEIRIVPLKALGDPVNFPGEAEHSDNIQDVTGRYFRNSNVMYLVPQRHYLNWKKSFGHEMAHHLFDACNVHFVNDYIEHHAIEPFEESIDG